MKLTFENAKPEHKDGILNLWNKHSGWGPVTWDQVNAWKVTPYEEVIHGLAIDENEVIVGQIIFTFCRVRCNNEVLKAGRILAPVINKDVIKNISIKNLNHPFIQLYKWIFDEAKKHSVEIIYMYPDIKWRSVLGLAARFFDLPKLIGSALDYYTINCNDYLSYENSEYNVKIAENFSDIHHQLWTSCLSGYQNYLALERDIDYLNFKAGNEIKLEIWRENDLVGLMIFNKSRNLIYDLFMKPGIKYDEAIKSALRVVNENLLSNKTKVKFLGSRCMLNYFNGLPISKFDFSLLFAWSSLSSKFDSNSNWYLSSLN